MNMLKSTLLGVALFASASSFAQGTINFANRITGSIDAKITDAATGLGASGLNGFFAQLYVSATGAEGSFVAAGVPVALRSDAGIGYVVASVVTTALAGGTTAHVYLAGWSGAATYEAAGFRRATSNTIQIPLGNPSGTPPTTPASLTGLQGFTVPVPEPGVMSLAAVGGLGLLALRRKNG